MGNCLETALSRNQNMMHAKIKTLHSDHGGEYLSDAFKKHLAKQGTVHKLTVHDTSEQNGVAEVFNRIYLERVHAILHASGLPKFLWGEAVRHVVWLKNRTSTAVVAAKTPIEVVTGKKPNLAELPE
jgi:transposase InsO family protein